MTQPEQIDENDADLLAGEYVVGILPHDERQKAVARIDSDPGFADMVDGWQQRLAPLMDEIPPVVPDPAVWAKIESSLPKGPVHPALRQRGRSGPLLAILFMALAAIAVMTGIYRSQPAPLVALLQEKTGTATVALSYSRSDDSLTLRSTLPPAPGKSYELWVIAPQQAPLSIGVIDAAPELHPQLAALSDSDLAQLTFAVTVEQAGGSPTGKPTSQPIMAGQLQVPAKS